MFEQFEEILMAIHGQHDATGTRCAGLHVVISRCWRTPVFLARQAPPKTA